MDFLKKVGTTAESLLDQVDQRGAEYSKEVRSGSREARRVVEKLEKRERSVLPSSDDEVSKQIEQLHEDLDAAGEVLVRTQELAAEREAKLTTLLASERSERERREEELVDRIKSLENKASRAQQLEELVTTLEQEMTEAKGSRDQDTVHLEAQLEAASADAEHARSALSKSALEAAARTADLERVNLELVRELTALRSAQTGEHSPDSFGDEVATPLDGEKQRLEQEARELEERIRLAEDRKTTAEMELRSEKVRSETEVRRLTDENTSLKQEMKKSQTTFETSMSSVRKELDEARLELERLRRINQDNGRDALEKRLESLSSHLELKQRQIDTLRSEKSALEQRIAEPASLDVDARMGVRARFAHQSFPVENLRRNRVSKLKIDPDKHKQLARAVDALDGLTISAGAMMKAQPLLRLLFVGYVLLLHLWVIHVINFTSHPLATAPLQTPSLRGST